MTLVEYLMDTFKPAKVVPLGMRWHREPSYCGKAEPSANEDPAKSAFIDAVLARKQGKEE